MYNYIMKFSERQPIQTCSVEPLHSYFPGDLGMYITEIYLLKSVDSESSHIPCHVMLDMSPLSR